MKDPRYLQFQKTLGENSVGLVTVNGYDRLKSSIEDVADWDGFQAIWAQIDTTLWFKDKGILKEIEPHLPHRVGCADILLSFSEQDIYCEVTSPESMQKSLESKKNNEAEKVRILLGKEPWMSKQHAEHEFKIRRAVKHWMSKTKQQLPANYPGILAIDTGKAWLSHFDVKIAVKRLFPKRPQLVLIMLWNPERDSQIGEAPFWFINTNSPYQNIGQELLKYLWQDNKVIS